MTTMPIEDCEELDLKLGLLGAVRLNARLLQIQNNTNAVLIVVTHQTVMCIGAVSNHIRHEWPLRHFGFLDGRVAAHSRTSCASNLLRS